MSNSIENWTLEIKPKRHIFDINLKELWRYKDLILLFVRRDLVAQYKQTILGPLWYIINPFLSSVVYTLVFGRMAKLSTDGLPPMVFYMSGLVTWNYFALCLQKTSSTFVSNANIFGKVYFPRLSIPISTVISSIIQFLIQFLFLLGFIFYYKMKGAEINMTYYIFLFPLFIILIAGLSLGFGIVISALTTKYRDLQNLISFGVKLWMYATPVIYPLSSIPEKYQKYLFYNPMTHVTEAFRYTLFQEGMISLNGIIYSVVFTISLLALGIIIFNKVEQNFMDTV